MTPRTPDTATPFAVLVVCTGNICRSPVAEQLLRARLAAAGVEAMVRSAGTRAMIGDAMTAEAAALSRHYGGEPDAHRAQQLTAELVAEADLVLTASREHRASVVSLYPRASRYTYTLTEFARLAESMGGQAENASHGDLLADVAATRGSTPPPEHASADDIEDPYRRSVDVYDRVGGIIDHAVTTIVSTLLTAKPRV